MAATSPDRRPDGDLEGRAALLLVQSLIVNLVEKGILGPMDVEEIFTVAIETEKSRLLEENVAGETEVLDLLDALSHGQREVMPPPPFAATSGARPGRRFSARRKAHARGPSRCGSGSSPAFVGEPLVTEVDRTACTKLGAACRVGGALSAPHLPDACRAP